MTDRGYVDVRPVLAKVADLERELVLIFRFAVRDHHAKELYRTKSVDPADAIVDDARLPEAFRERRLAQMKDQLAARAAATDLGGKGP